ncbi:sugar ABC transporter permease [Mesobacillus foraminis]|uniref:carbohydrate ABC transporter permease n=1 Tax=Mesobacillus foraminis TaxID=279826 RepID=UPI001BE7735D|nr:sugar ABC transporter permease [Mesobacillus foraminis]MBT2759274.1 sugar ABC transporter permease [Mesobacillus foraminis]
MNLDRKNAPSISVNLPAKPAASVQKKKKMKAGTFQYLILLLPPLLFFVVGMVIPLIMGIYNSFTDWDGLSLEKNWIGLTNYMEIFKDEMFLNSFKFTALFMVFNTLIQNVAAFLFAVMLDSNIKGKNFYRTIIFAPVLLSPILVGQIWTKMYGTILPSINDMLGLSINFNFFSSPDTVMTGLLIANNWQWIGYWMLIYLAGLQAVPKDIYEACTVDGGSWWQKFIHITIPMLGPSITICTIGIATGSLKVYELIVASTGGGPGDSSKSTIMYIYDSAFMSQQSSYASAMSVIFLLVLLVFAFIQLKVLRKREVEL